MADDEIIYLDNNATTPLDPAVIEEMPPFLREYYGNPSSGYAFAAKAREGVDLARERHKHRLDMFLMRSHMKKMEALSVLVACRITILIAAILLPVSLTSCGKKSQDGEEKTAQQGEDDFLDKDAKPDERKYLLAAKPFLVAVANQQYADAYALLSSHARARMSLNQFTPAAERADFQRNESNPFINVTAEQFAELMKYVEAAHGIPRAPKMLHVFSTDADVLNRRSKEQLGAVDSMFAIGAMPDSIPGDIRRASLRGQIHTELSPEELEKVARAQGISAEELQKDENFDPYFNLKLVLVEEDGQLEVGYFEFLPPSMMD